MSFSIKFDYRFDDDGFFDDPDRRAILALAASEWERRINDEFDDIPAGAILSVPDPENPSQLLTVELSEPIDDLLIFVGSNDQGGYVTLPDGSRQATTGQAYSVFGGDGDAMRLRTVADFRGQGPTTDFEPFIGSIALNNNPEIEWSFDPDGPVAGFSDAYSTVIHEIGHILGIGASPTFDTLIVGTGFTGVNARQENNGAPFPLEPDGYHVLDGFAGDTVVMDPLTLPGTRKIPTPIDLALLADIGYEIDGYVKQGAPFALTTAGDDNPVFGSQAGDVIDGLGGNDWLQGEGGSDRLSGGDGADILFGGSGSDTLNGDDGDDQIQGNTGEDVINGGQGDDDLFGGDDYDTYVFEGDWGDDFILDPDPDGRVRFVGYGQSDLTFSQSGSNLFITAGANRVILFDYYANGSAYDFAFESSADTVREGTDTSAVLTDGVWQSGTIDAEPIAGDGVTSDLVGGFVDKDWFRVTLAPDRTYSFDAESLSLTTGLVFIRLYDSAGNAIDASFEAEGAAPSFTYSTAGQSGGQTYYLAVSAGDTNDSDFRAATGDFRVMFTNEGEVSTAETTYSMAPGVEIVDEGNRTLTFTVTRSGTNLQSETLYASTYSLTAASTSLGADKDGDGAIDDDYNGLIDVPVEFIGSAETATFTVRVNDDTHFEGSERFEVFLATADNAGRFDSSVVDSSIVTIRDDADAPAQVTYDLSVDPRSFSEADRTITFKITRSDDSEDASVWFSTAQDAGFDNIGDYDGISDREVFFAAGDSVETVALRINEDSALEADETFGAIVQQSRFDSFTTYEDRTTFTILNDDAGTESPPVISGRTSQSHAPGTLLNMSAIFTVSDPDGDLSTITILDRDTTGGGEWLYNGSPITLGEVWEAPSFSPFELGNLQYQVGTGANDFQVQATDSAGNVAGLTIGISGVEAASSLPPNIQELDAILSDPSTKPWVALEKTLEYGVEIQSALLDEAEFLKLKSKIIAAGDDARELVLFNTETRSSYRIKPIFASVIDDVDDIAELTDKWYARVSSVVDTGILANIGSGLAFIDDAREIGASLYQGWTEDEALEAADSLTSTLVGGLVGGAVTTIGGLAIAALAIPSGGASLAATGIVTGAGVYAVNFTKNILDDNDVFKSVFQVTTGAISGFVQDTANFVSVGLGGEKIFVSPPIYWSDEAYSPYRIAGSTAPVFITDRVSFDDPEVMLAGDETEAGALGDGADVYWGIGNQLAGDTLFDFSAEDAGIVIGGTNAARQDIRIDDGSAIIRLIGSGTKLDTDPLTLQGDFSGGDFMAVSNGADTFLSFHPYLPTLQDGVAVEASDINGVTNPAFLSGMASSTFQVELSGQADLNNAIGVYEVDKNGIIRDVRLISKDAQADLGKTITVDGVEQDHALGFFVVEGGAAWASSLALDDLLKFAVSDVTGAPRLELHVNGALANQTVHHSIDRSLNADGLEHVLSGVTDGGTSMLLAFEENSSGGDRDFNDVVLEISPFDASAMVTDSDGDLVSDNADNAIFVANPDQRDSNGDGYGNVIDADLTNDGVIDVEDLLIFRRDFGSTGFEDGVDAAADADFDGNGAVDVDDLLTFRELFGQPLGASFVDDQMI